MALSRVFAARCMIKYLNSSLSTAMLLPFSCCHSLVDKVCNLYGSTCPRGGGGGGGGGGTPIFSYIRRLGSFLGVQNFEFQYFGGFSEKKNILGGMKLLWIFFGVITKLDNIYWSFLCILGSFLKVKVQKPGIFLGLPKIQIFLAVLEIPDIFWAGPKPTYEEK